MRVLITGASGRVGKRIIEALDDLFDPSIQVDLLKHKTALPQITRPNTGIVTNLSNDYDLAFHFAANANVKYCENKENRAEVNESNIGLTSEVCDFSNKVIYASTDQVFKGDVNDRDPREHDPVNPHGYYGETKAESEKLVLKNKGVVVRLGGVFGVENRMMGNVKNALKGKNYFPFWTNVLLKPTHFADILRVLKKIKDSDESAIYHVMSDGKVLTRAGVARITLDTYRKWGFDRKRDEFEYEARIPEGLKLVLDTTKTKEKLGLQFTDSRQAIKEHVLWMRR
jgi:dTDP-4-dehydrorhamnose reductase